MDLALPSSNATDASFDAPLTTIAEPSTPPATQLRPRLVCSDFDQEVLRLGIADLDNGAECVRDFARQWASMRDEIWELQDTSVHRVISNIGALVFTLCHFFFFFFWGGGGGVLPTVPTCALEFSMLASRVFQFRVDGELTWTSVNTAATNCKN